MTSPQLSATRDIMVLSDEIYSRLISKARTTRLWRSRDLRIALSCSTGFSKTYAMTGWRMGYGVMRADLAKEIALLATNATSCTASFTQMAGVEALRGDQSSVEKMKASFKRRLDALWVG